MKIAVSACLLGKNCKYDGGNNQCQKVLDFVKVHDIVAVCPEQMGGLPTPRVPAEIVNGVVTNVHGISVDEAFRRGARLASEAVLNEGATLAILQPRSPSCGCKCIYDGTFAKQLVPGKGVFAQLLEENGIKAIEPEDLP